jgi:hypothetical protein
VGPSQVEKIPAALQESLYSLLSAASEKAPMHMVHPRRWGITPSDRARGTPSSILPAAGQAGRTSGAFWGPRDGSEALGRNPGPRGRRRR